MFSRGLLNSSRFVRRCHGTHSIHTNHQALANAVKTPRVQVRLLSTEIKEAIDKAVESSKVVLFMKGTPEFPQCGFSRATIQILGQQGVDPEVFAAYNVLEDPELREGIKEYSSWPTIPQLYVNKEFVGGCDIIMSMSKSGELAELLESSGALIPEEEEAPGSADVKVSERS
ncbi:glutaredoxin [Suhomyces tanzawaensis NRRL Y-17324]|uniref:Monothiol glutaredoxin-5, mitochondrial n=1 Tax=Suhomyces tanzawaensis NRRL Y-17324 TaxID=984487 RepID=A0A1E4SDM4_9ASCO|nr:glutaredoxin [Suhomyces tanzawaensis NRRL Y-17324]ODV77492.1 glutaredoxin [Suhomyces tanzawaensis NRRL Y-17324]